MGDEIDFDDLLAEAEQEGDMYDEYMDDIEAEMAMEAEESTRTPSGRSSLPGGVGIGLGVGAPPAAGLAVNLGGPFGVETKAGGVVGQGGGATGMAPLALGSPSSRNHHYPSPLPLERRLGVSPLEDSPIGGSGGGSGGGGDSGEVLRALNSDGLSPLHPVLKDSSNSTTSRWSGRRLTSTEGGGGGASAATGGRATMRGSRPEEASSRPAFSLTRTATAPGAAGPRRVDTRGTVLSRPSIDGDSLPFMQSGGRMMHLRVRHRTPPPSSPPPPSETTTSTTSNAFLSGGSLLRTPMATLMERVTERRVIERSLATAAMERRLAEAGKGEEEELEETDDGSGMNNGGGTSKGGGRNKESNPSGSRSKAVEGGGALWVDKYAPEVFRDLLSDERINREVLRAVKAWDLFVFKREPATSSSAAGDGGGGPNSKKSLGQLLQSASSGDDAAADKRPEGRVIMLCGPPGLGKTTLAQVVARHAGYRVYEINASDDRTAPVLRKRMIEAMEGNTLLADKRPNLIVLDEVDGADGKAAAQVIVDIATAPLTKNANTNGKKPKKKALTRPLVLICNDQWSPALRPIRALAQVFVFRPKASPARLVQRLKAICSAERLCVNTDALTRLADRSHLDVRSCLNTLQFVARRAVSGGVRNASAALLTAVAEGVKDDRRDLFEVLRLVFTRRKSGTKRRLFIGGEQGSAGVYVADRKNADIFEEVQAFNDNGKVLSGVHENFLGARYNDPTLCKAAAAMDWLEMADLMDARTHQTQDYSFSRYAPLAAAGVHYLCRSDQRTAVSQPKKDFEARSARSTKNNILHSFVDGRQLAATGRTTQAVVMDMLSHLMDILAPTLRPLNPDLLSHQERARFQGLVGVLSSCGLTFAPQSAALAGGGGGAAGAYGARGGAFPGGGGGGIIAQEFALEPAIDQLVKYEGYDFAHPTLAAPLRSMVAHEVSLEAMRQAEVAKKPHAGNALTRKNDEEGTCKTSPENGVEEGPAGPQASFSSSAAAAARVAGQPTLFGSKAGLQKSSGRAGTTGTSASRKGGSNNTLGREAPEISQREGGEGEAKKEKGSGTPQDENAESDRRPAHVIPFWSRTNWISGRKEDAGSSQDHKSSSNGSGDKGAVNGKDGNSRDTKSLSPSKRTAAEIGRGGEGGRRLGDSSAGPVPKKRTRRQEEESAAAAAAANKLSVRFQFKAGYTNAVRRPVRMRDLL